VTKRVTFIIIIIVIITITIIIIIIIIITTTTAIIIIIIIITTTANAIVIIIIIIIITTTTLLISIANGKSTHTLLRMLSERELARAHHRRPLQRALCLDDHPVKVPLFDVHIYLLQRGRWNARRLQSLMALS
jgi:hypothetical protein